ncbi:MAG: extracellular solute-binding protein, partial [Eubacteriales bacterium]
MKQKKLAVLIAATVTLTTILTGCGGSGGDANSNSNSGGNSTVTTDSTTTTTAETLSGTITFAIWDNNLNDFIESNDMISKFQEVYPDIEIEVEKIKDDSEYWNTMKMRASANQLPDVMFNKTFTLSRFKDYLIDLSGTQAYVNNELAEGYALNGQVLGVPVTAGYEYVYYWKDMFEEVGVEVPQTWNEFTEVAKALQDYYGASNSNFMGIACGMKDEWPNYPYTEFMPALESGNGQNWNTMAAMDEPFAEG